MIVDVAGSVAFVVEVGRVGPSVEVLVVGDVSVEVEDVCEVCYWSSGEYVEVCSWAW